MSDNEFYERVRHYDTEPLWVVGQEILSAEPVTRVEPHIWKWRELRTLLRTAAEEVEIQGAADRRVLLLANPGLKGQHATSHTLTAAVQIIKPGETAGTHRHTPAAIRFIIEGSGAYTVVDGEKVVMSEGDFVLTPQWTWHDHANPASGPVIWLDCLDVPLIQSLNAMFFQLYPNRGIQPSSVSSDSTLIYSWESAYERLRRMEETPCDGSVLEYQNRLTGGPALPSLACSLQRLRPGLLTESHRHTSTTISLAVRGQGATQIGDLRFEWERGDVFVTPPWAVHRHENRSAEESILFCMSDRPVLEAFGLYREDALTAQHSSR
jgi:gentisate 1,2-dioxygenase